MLRLQFFLSLWFYVGFKQSKISREAQFSKQQWDADRNASRVSIEYASTKL